MQSFEFLQDPQRTGEGRNQDGELLWLTESDENILTVTLSTVMTNQRLENIQAEEELPSDWKS